MLLATPLEHQELIEKHAPILQPILGLELVPSLIQRAKYCTRNHPLFRRRRRWNLHSHQSRLSIGATSCSCYTKVEA
jgi:hypothetical protein